jgi:hypothetical protein
MMISPLFIFATLFFFFFFIIIIIIIIITLFRFRSDLTFDLTQSLIH